MPATVEPVVMDSRKFLNIINNSSQSRVSLFESLVKKLGDKSGEQWQLAALFSDTLFIECVGSRDNDYYVANHKRLKGGRIQITSVRPVRLVEEHKQTLFTQNCKALVEAIEKNDQRAMRTVYNNLSAQRFSPRTIPESGIVRTRDGITRKLRVDVGELLTIEDRDKIIGALVESVNDTVVLENGRVVSACFGEDISKRIPISEWACRRVVGRHMRDTATNAFRSPGFQNRIYKIAKFINEDKIKEAIENLKDFLAEQQEFCLMTKQETQDLIENTLATKAVMNQQLCIDTATLFYRTNLKVNRNTIIKEWKATAQKAQHPTLLENIIILEQSKNFDGAYNTFLEMAFNEALSPRDEEVAAYRLALDMLKTNPKIQEDHELRTKVNDLITKLSDQNVDDATVHLVRETLASAKQEADSLSRLSDFDQIPGDEPSLNEPDGDAGLGDELADTTSTGTGGGPVINVNAPLISIGGGADIGGTGLGGDTDLGDIDGGDGGDDSDMGDIGDMDDMGDMGDEDDSDMGDMGDMGDDDEEDFDLSDFSNASGRKRKSRGDREVNLHLDSKQKINPPLSEATSKTNVDKKEDKCVGDDCDPYAFGENVNFETSMGHDYGNPIITNDMNDVIASMVGIAEDKQLIDSKLLDKIDDIAMEAIKANGIKIPEHRLSSAISQISAEFGRRLNEDQFKWGTLFRRRGMNKNRINKKEREAYKGSNTKSRNSDIKENQSNDDSAERTIQWLEHDEKNSGILGTINGVKFILDYANPPMIFSEDGNSVEIPIPEELVNSALVAVGVVGKQGTAVPFTKWLYEGIEQFRPISEEDETALDEAVATITAGPDGEISVSVDSDVNVEQSEDESPEELVTKPDLDDIEMQPIADIGDSVDDEEIVNELPGDKMPDFEGGEHSVETGPEPDETVIHDDDDDDNENEEEVEEEGDDITKPSVSEEKDITTPENKGQYDTTKQDHRDGPKEAGKAQKPKDGKNLDGFDKKPESIKTDTTDVKLKKIKPGKNRLK